MWLWVVVDFSDFGGGSRANGDVDGYGTPVDVVGRVGRAPPMPRDGFDGRSARLETAGSSIL